MITQLIYDFKLILIILVAIEGSVGIITFIYDHLFNKKLIESEDKVLLNPQVEFKYTKKQSKIDELRKICQKSFRLGYGIYGVRLKIIKRISIYITFLLIRTPVTPSQITLFMIVIGFLSSILFSFGNYWTSLIAVLLLPFHLILDAVQK